jgi:hypothetical protein
MHGLHGNELKACPRSLGNGLYKLYRFIDFYGIKGVEP